jgi:hypothetical protein
MHLCEPLVLIERVENLNKNIIDDNITNEYIIDENIMNGNMIKK